MTTDTPQPPHQRPWYRWHWLTWLVGVVVVAGLIARQLEEQEQGGFSSLGVTWLYSDFGWPMTYVQRTWTMGGINSTDRFTADEWHGWRLAANTLFCGLLTVAAIVVTEHWLRRHRRWQFGLATTAAATAVVAGFLVLSREWVLPYREFDFESWQIHWSLVSTGDLSRPIRWPSLFALACLLYSAAWLLLQAADLAWRAVVRSQR